MTRVLLTGKATLPAVGKKAGGSGFLAAHVLNALLAHGHSVVTTVRSQDKADKIKAGHADVGKDKLDFAIVEDISKEGAFEQAVVSNPPFEVVIHTASPFHFNATDVKAEILAPAIVGTTGILKSIKAKAPTVKRCIITSSFASINDLNRKWDGYEYSEKDWSPVTMEEAESNAHAAYVGSKAFAEKAAWAFAEKEKPDFSITTICPPLVLGPVSPELASLGAMNTSNATIARLIEGQFKDGLPPTRVTLWIDVRDCALAHVLAMEKPEAAGRRFLTVAGLQSNAEVAGIIAAEFPEYRGVLPTGEALKSGELPPVGQRQAFDRSRADKVFGLKYRTVKEMVVDAVKSMKALQT